MNIVSLYEKGKKFWEAGKKVVKKWRPGAKSSLFLLYFVMATQASYICFSCYNALDIFSDFLKLGLYRNMYIFLNQGDSMIQKITRLFFFKVIVCCFIFAA